MRTAIVSGANRGVGREIARQLFLRGYRVLFTSRDETKGKQSFEKLKEELGIQGDGELVFHQLDVTDPRSIHKLHDMVVSEYEAADVLVNNAAVLLDQCGRILQTELDIYRATFETNLYGPLALSQAFIPLMLERNYGRVVNVSSGAGQVEDMIDDMTAYRLSKIALNGMTLILAKVVEGTNVLVNAGCPGWVRTDMGSPEAPRSPEEGAAGIVWLATLPDGGPNGGFFRDKQRLAW
jgi:NAD(P)-dependent dehydrogenase (short-subunit alcohol dehydrogenase family)